MHGFFYNASLSPLAKIPTKTNNFRSISDSDTIQALIHTDNRRFKIPTSNVGPPPPLPRLAEPLYQVSRLYSRQFRIQERLNRIWSHAQ